MKAFYYNNKTTFKYLNAIYIGTTSKHITFQITLGKFISLVSLDNMWSTSSI